MPDLNEQLEKARFDAWVKEDRIPPIQRKHHWKTWLRALGQVEQEAHLARRQHGSAPDFDTWQRGHFASIMAHMRAAENNDTVLSSMIQSAIKGAYEFGRTQHGSAAQAVAWLLPDGTVSQNAELSASRCGKPLGFVAAPPVADADTYAWLSAEAKKLGFKTVFDAIMAASEYRALSRLNGEKK